VEISRVSVLLATGLIEAEISALEPIARYSSAQVATVIRPCWDGGIEHVRTAFGLVLRGALPRRTAERSASEGLVRGGLRGICPAVHSSSGSQLMPAPHLRSTGDALIHVRAGTGQWGALQWREPSIAPARQGAAGSSAQGVFDEVDFLGSRSPRTSSSSSMRRPCVTEPL